MEEMIMSNTTLIDRMNERAQRMERSEESNSQAETALSR